MDATGREWEFHEGARGSDFCSVWCSDRGCACLSFKFIRLSHSCYTRGTVNKITDRTPSSKSSRVRTNKRQLWLAPPRQRHPHPATHLPRHSHGIMCSARRALMPQPLQRVACHRPASLVRLLSVPKLLSFSDIFQTSFSFTKQATLRRAQKSLGARPHARAAASAEKI